MGKINSRQKGAAGERAWRDFLRSYGLEARRGQQFSGSPDSPDVVCPAMDQKWHPEVKRTEALSLYKAMGQAIGDCGTKKPYVAHRRNNKDWLVVLRAEDFIELVLEVARGDRSLAEPSSVKASPSLTTIFSNPQEPSKETT